MIEKKIKFTDFLGNDKEVTYHFNISKSELAKLEMKVEGGFQSFIKKIMETESIPVIADQFNKIIKLSYGEISPDGSSFMKTDPVRGDLGDWFEQTAAYDVLFMELITEDGAASSFIEGVIPSDVLESVKNEAAGNAYPPQIAKS